MTKGERESGVTGRISLGFSLSPPIVGLRTLTSEVGCSKLEESLVNYLKKNMHRWPVEINSWCLTLETLGPLSWCHLGGKTFNMAETEVTVRTHSRNIVGLSQREEGRERKRRGGRQQLSWWRLVGEFFTLKPSRISQTDCQENLTPRRSPSLRLSDCGGHWTSSPLWIIEAHWLQSYGAKLGRP